VVSQSCTASVIGVINPIYSRRAFNSNMGSSIRNLHEASTSIQFAISLSSPPSVLPTALVQFIPTVADPPRSTYTSLADPPQLGVCIAPICHLIGARGLKDSRGMWTIQQYSGGRRYRGEYWCCVFLGVAKGFAERNQVRPVYFPGGENIVSDVWI